MTYRIPEAEPRGTFEDRHFTALFGMEPLFRKIPDARTRIAVKIVALVLIMALVTGPFWIAGILR